MSWRWKGTRMQLLPRVTQPVVKSRPCGNNHNSQGRRCLLYVVLCPFSHLSASRFLLFSRFNEQPQQNQRGVVVVAAAIVVVNTHSIQSHSCARETFYDPAPLSGSRPAFSRETPEARWILSYSLPLCRELRENRSPPAKFSLGATTQRAPEWLTISMPRPWNKKLTPPLVCLPLQPP